MIRSRRSLVVLFLLAATLTLLLLGSHHALPSAPSLHLPGYGDAFKDRVTDASVEDRSHPVYQLFAEAQENFKGTRARQSQSLADAVAEYRRRYGIPPPPHFDKWFEFARKRNVQLIDEFDQIYHSLLPFWSLEPQILRERVRKAIGFDNDMISVLIRNGTVVKAEGGGKRYEWHREATPVMLEEFVEHLADMDLAFNIHDEPRIILQHDDLDRHFSVATTQSLPVAAETTNPRNSWSPRPQDMDNGERIKEYRTTRFNEFSHQPTWSNSRISCPLDSAARACINDSCPDHTAAYSQHALGLLRNVSAYSDICNSPSFETTFGFFDRPNTFDVAHELIPTFSQSKISSFQDILYPSPWYYTDRVRYDREEDHDWDEKNTTMFWRGSTTGGFSRDGGWRRQHRQRFLQKIQPFGTTSILEPDPNDPSSSWREVEAPMSELSHYFDVKFTYVGQCDPGDCDAQRAFFDIVEPVNMFEALESKYLLDIDGNAFSGRFYAWLRSNSLVFKLALFREWHDDWLVPWVHYIPLTLKGDEYGELMRYFSEDRVGQQIARTIADQSRTWAQLVLRNEDIEAWYFRLLLEYGRLIDDDRNVIGFSL